MVINWTLALLSHRLFLLFHAISLEHHTPIPLLMVHFKSLVPSPEPMGFFVSPHLLVILQCHIRPSLEYCFRVWGGAQKSTLCLLDQVQSKAIRLINNPYLTKSLQPLPHRRLAGGISIFYRYVQGHCSKEIRDIILVPLRRVRTTRTSTHSHPFQISLPKPRILSHKSSFIPRTCKLFNLLPSYCFPEFYNLPSFKSMIGKLGLICLSS